MERGRKYKLKRFNGTYEPTSDIEPSENYWRLIGQIGTLIGLNEDFDFPYQNRVLIKFDLDLIQEGLESHNEVPNSIWILKSDLASID